jgi:membrane fusion protein (multidrug efflux system)
MNSALRQLSLTKRILLGGVIVAICATGFAYWRHASRFRSTENGYVNAEVVQVSSLVAGRVVAVHVEDNQPVHKGDPLFDVDPEPFRVSVARARAQLALARQGTHQDVAEVDALRAELARQKSDLANAETAQARAEDLVKQGFTSRQAIDDARAKVVAGRALVAQADARLQKAIAALAPKNGESPAVAAALANLRQAELDLSNAHVTAPQDGWIVNKTLTPGTSVSPGQPLFGLIVDRSFWVDANFKETELADVKPGQRAEIEVDMYPRHRFAGHVDSLSGGTGTAFSLLPPQNATGNWVKVTQRVPVKIRFDGFDPAFPLRVGATATVTVRVK